MEPFYEYLNRANHDVKPHQEAGVAWCLNAERTGTMVEGTLVRGGFLADEMGLGKTNQMLGTCLCNAKRRTLIVLPRALLEQWLTIIRKTLGHNPIVFHGHRKRGVTLEDLRQAPFVLATYGMLANEGLLHEVAWARAIFDEAHHLRNKNTAVHRGAAKLRVTIRWLVTGTPVQNKLSDFRNLCALFGVSGKDLPAAKALILRRTKTVAGVVLPRLQEHLTSVRWADTNEAKLARHYDEVGDEGMRPIVCLLRARQACVLPALIDPRCSASSKLDKVVERIRANATNGRAKLVFCHFRGEIDELKRRLEEPKRQLEEEPNRQLEEEPKRQLEEEPKRQLEEPKRQLEEPKRRLGGEMRIATFDGRVTPAERQAVLARPLDVLLCQIQTGCEGLNLQQFEEVYFVSPHWNPAVEDQAVARCHRIGQQRTVDVYRFCMDGYDEGSTSVEAYVRGVQAGKREIARELV